MENCCRFVKFSHKRNTCKKKWRHTCAWIVFLIGVAMENFLLIPMTLNRKSLPLEHSFWLTSVFTQTGRWSFYLCYYWCCVTRLLKTLIPVSILHWLGVFSRRTWNCAKSACLFYRVNLETANFLNSNTDSNYFVLGNPQNQNVVRRYTLSLSDVNPRYWSFNC